MAQAHARSLSEGAVKGKGRAATPWAKPQEVPDPRTQSRTATILRTAHVSVRRELEPPLHGRGSKNCLTEGGGGRVCKSRRARENSSKAACTGRVVMKGEGTSRGPFHLSGQVIAVSDICEWPQGHNTIAAHGASSPATTTARTVAYMPHTVAVLTGLVGLKRPDSNALLILKGSFPPGWQGASSSQAGITTVASTLKGIKRSSSAAALGDSLAASHKLLVAIRPLLPRADWQFLNIERHRPLRRECCSC